MKILLDENLPKKLKFNLGEEHTVHTAQEMGWGGKKNGELLELIKSNGFDLFITIDKNLKYQQNVKNLTFTIFILDAPNSKISTLSPFANEVTSRLSEPLEAGITDIKI